MGAGNFSNISTVHAAMRIAQRSGRGGGGGGFRPDSPKKEPRRQECEVCGHQNIIKELEVDNSKLIMGWFIGGLIIGNGIAATVIWMLHN